MSAIPIFDPQPEIDLLWEELNDAIQGVLRSGLFIMGTQVAAFEREAAAYLGVKHAIAVNSGTDALVIALRALGIGPGDEVITSPFTFFATAEAIEQVGAIPVFVDIEDRYYTIDAGSIEAVITPRTKAILPVHLYGQAADLDAIQQVAQRYGLYLVEDAAQSFGGEYQGVKLGTFGEAGCFSFFPTKNLGGYGDGGMLVTNDDRVAELAAMLRVHGSRQKYRNECVGYNSRLDEIQAAILRVKLKRIDEWNDLRREAAHRYHELLSTIGGLIVPSERECGKHVFHQYTVRLPEDRRDAVTKGLRQHGIGTMIYYPIPVHQLPVYKHLGITLPVAEACAREVFSLPLWPHLSAQLQSEVAVCLRRLLATETGSP
ncbi:DegT/DnrJ/EryC1/StrS family aminotransferase [Brevibacillus ruminantium]|uniref:DegT/DnrJ/EryC1/StrS family aminotransferase n=1 Tax=Brevibacillus ruminantium TaxID=2950604 RepID=A0ABY4WRC4_9BACL|nr:DegT/DnrJ/EryC1/StrS family aminotransferase [Brevibacillus ruminantium]USG67136.1 DegT/DnrJ/EryC1/StrS family aminotransferase [Brevibacillus ruminantium]